MMRNDLLIVISVVLFALAFLIFSLELWEAFTWWLIEDRVIELIEATCAGVATNAR
jgi:hypothetical protein